MGKYTSRLALLWFYTFGSQMLKYEDGYTSDQASSAANLIVECERRYPNSSIFLFFRGRVERMKVFLKYLNNTLRTCLIMFCFVNIKTTRRTPYPLCERTNRRIGFRHKRSCVYCAFMRLLGAN